MEVTRRRPTLSRHFSMIDSCNLRDLLKVREDEDEIRHRDPTVTLATILACEKQRDLSSSSPSSSNPASTTTNTRTLLEIIRDEDNSRSLVVRSGHGGTQSIRWRSFKDRLRLGRAISALSCVTRGSTSAVTITQGHGADRSPPPPSHNGTGAIATVESMPVTENMISLATHPPAVDPRPNGSAGRRPEEGLEEEPIRVSLMALLEQNDRMWNGADSLQGASAIAASMIGMVDGDDEVVSVEEEERRRQQEEEEERMATASAADVGGSGPGRTGWTPSCVCCVCMVRHKGAAFIPCGHTFCRLCSRELWIGRGSCPLCNAFILEILDIF